MKEQPRDVRPTTPPRRLPSIYSTLRRVARLNRGWADIQPPAKRTPPPKTQKPLHLTLKPVAPPTPPVRDALRELHEALQADLEPHKRRVRLQGVASLPGRYLLRTGIKVYRRSKLAPALQRLCYRIPSLRAASIETCYLVARRRWFEIRIIEVIIRQRRKEAYHAALNAAQQYMRRCWNTFRFKRRLRARLQTHRLVREVAEDAQHGMVLQKIWRRCKARACADRKARKILADELMRYHVAATQDARIQRYFTEDDQYYESRGEAWEDPNSFVKFVHLAGVGVVHTDVVLTTGARALFAAAQRVTDVAFFRELPDWRICVRGAKQVELYRHMRDACYAADKAVKANNIREMVAMAFEEKRTLCANYAALDRDATTAERIAQEAVLMLRERESQAWHEWLREQEERDHEAFLGASEEEAWIRHRTGASSPLRRATLQNLRRYGDEEEEERRLEGDCPEALECQCMYLEEQRLRTIRVLIMRRARQKEAEVLEAMRREEVVQRRFAARVAELEKRRLATRREIERQSENLFKRARVAIARGGLAAQRWVRAFQLWEEHGAMAETRAMGCEDLEKLVLQSYEQRH